MNLKLIRIKLIAIICAVLLVSSVFAIGTQSRVVNIVRAITDTGFVYVANSLTTGNIFQLKCRDNVLTTGKYIQCLGGNQGDTEVFSIAKQGNTYIKGTLTVDGGSTLKTLSTLAITKTNTNDLSVDSSMYGKIVLLSGDYSFNVNLPTTLPPAGTVIIFVNCGTNNTNPTYACATKIIAPNATAASSLNFGSTYRVGSTVMFVSNGSKWVAINLSTGCTMTVT